MEKCHFDKCSHYATELFSQKETPVKENAKNVVKKMTDFVCQELDVLGCPVG